LMRVAMGPRNLPKETNVVSFHVYVVAVILTHKMLAIHL